LVIILHIIKKGEWERAKPTGEYSGDTLASVGFIHCCTPPQLTGIANANHRAENDLVLLCIDTTKVRSPIRYEKSHTKMFPHILGPLNVDAVVKEIDFKPKPDGTFEYPIGIPA
jgi:uncharacterized protein (DUF952 family)